MSQTPLIFVKTGILDFILKFYCSQYLQSQTYTVRTRKLWKLLQFKVKKKIENSVQSSVKSYVIIIKFLNLYQK